MAEKLYIRDVGVCRFSKDGKKGQGDDGVLWAPDKKLAAVMDGISASKGSGMEDVQRLENGLKVVQNTRSQVRDAFFSLFASKHPERPGGKSTVSLLWLPDDFSKRAMVLSAGDSHILRLRKTKQKAVVDVLTDEHTLWMNVQHEDFQEDREMFAELHGKKLKSEFMMYQDKTQILGWLTYFSASFFCLDIFKGYRNFEHCELSTLQYLLYSCHVKMNNILTLSLGNTEKKAREVIGNGKSPSVRPGDRFALVSDGIYRDVLELEEIKDILQSEQSADAAADCLVETSHQKNIKRDDRVALVLDIISQ